jgi:hypothetical protein
MSAAKYYRHMTVRDSVPFQDGLAGSAMEKRLPGQIDAERARVTALAGVPVYRPRSSHHPMATSRLSGTVAESALLGPFNSDTRVRLQGGERRRHVVLVQPHDVELALNRSSRRELINIWSDKRYARRDNKRQLKQSDDVGRSLSSDRRRQRRTTSAPTSRTWSSGRATWRLSSGTVNACRGLLKSVRTRYNSRRLKITTCSMSPEVRAVSVWPSVDT